MLHFWKDHWHNDADLNKLPKTIGDFYEIYFSREFGSGEKFKSVLPVLEVLVSAFEPMQVNRVFEVINVREALDFDYENDYTLQRHISLAMSQITPLLFSTFLLLSGLPVAKALKSILCKPKS